MQTILHVLFLPTPFKLLAATNAAKDNTPQGPLDVLADDMPEEVLLPGALYADCAAVKINVKIPDEVRERDRQIQAEAAKARANGKGKKKEQGSGKDEVLDLVDDGEYGGELAGRLVWEEYEAALKNWEKENPGKVEEQKGDSLQVPEKVDQGSS